MSVADEAWTHDAGTIADGAWNEPLLEASAPASTSYGALLERLREWSPGQYAAVLYVDLRNMREINRLGTPQEGDRLLNQVEAAIADWAGGKAISQRLWSNEFVAIRPIDHTQAAADEAALLRARLSHLSYHSAIGPTQVSVAIGLSVYRQGEDWERALAEAGHACLVAKRRGMNQICRFGAASGPLEASQFSPLVMTEFREWLRLGQLVLHAQPIMDISRPEPRIAKAEFLMRIERNGVHVPLPSGAIPALEHFGLASELDRHGCSLLLDWLDGQREVLDRVHNLSLNLSAASMLDGRFVDYLFREVKNARLPANKLCFEITETAAIANLDVAAEVIAAFRAIGCRFSLDDFGAGLCSFAYLQSLAIDEVKIDGRFMRDIAQDPVSREIVRAIHQVANATGKKTVAEFVDDARKLGVLRQIGVDYAQGWLFYPAVSPDKLIELLNP
jgi:EAL domain-containing protein (putative c-di-GMP-specific phosphodiesterase class I)/GGDEF domain-containing protein